MTVTIKDSIIANDFYKKSVVVADFCLRGLQSITVANPSDNAWSGRIEVTDGGHPTLITCDGCSGLTSLSNGEIVVDGNLDATKLATTHCLDGKTCSLTWQSIYIYHNQSLCILLYTLEY